MIYIFDILYFYLSYTRHDQKLDSSWWTGLGAAGRRASADCVGGEPDRCAAAALLTQLPVRPRAKTGE